MNFLIKKTSVEDLFILEKLEKSCFQEEAWNLSQIESHHQGQSSLLYLEESKSIHKGYLFYLENQFELELLRIGVPFEFRRQGIAEKLIEALIQISGIREIFLEVKSENFPAIELYKKKGFIIFALRKKYYPDGKDAILMKRHCI